MISIIIPARNEEKLIAGCLASLKNQDYTGNYEIVVVDNASQDNTAKIASDSGARVVCCSRPGVSQARQFGAESAQGEIIIQADADTVYPTWWLTRVKKQFDSHPSAIGVAGTFIYKNPPRWAYFEYFLRMVTNLLSTLVLKRPFIISGANFAFYSSALKQIGGYEPQSYSPDQFNISTRLSRIGKIVYDRKSWCATSERSVAKPLGTICVDFVRHLKNFAVHMGSGASPSIKRRAKKVISVSPKKYLVFGIPVLVIGILCYGYYVPSSPVFGKVYYRSITNEKVIALTYDDGPNEPYTSELLTVLNAHNVKATFFLIGENVKNQPASARSIVAEGHVIGNHTNTHNANHALFFDTYQDIALAQTAIFSVTGFEPHLYRPPHGKKSPWELGALKNQGLVEVLWNISTNELSGKPVTFLAQQIIDKAQPGGVILLHDGYGTQHGTAQANKHNTVVITSMIIEALQAKGYSFVTVPQLLELPAYYKVAE